MTFKIQTAPGVLFDLMPYIMTGGISWKRKYVAGGNNMTMQSGLKILDRVASKFEWTIAFRPMTATEQATILGLLDPQSVILRTTDPETAADVTATYYVGELPSGYLVQRADGTPYWGGLTATFEAR